MLKILMIFMGGGIGTLARYFFSIHLNPLFVRFPLGTFAANVLACFTLGVVSSFLMKKTVNEHYIYGLLIIGFCGGFSTFSSYVLELTDLYVRSLFFTFLYAGLSIVISLVALFAGLMVGKL